MITYLVVKRPLLNMGYYVLCVQLVLYAGDGATLLPVESFKSWDLPRMLFEHYQSAVPPGKNPDDRVNVNIAFSLYRVLDLVRETRLCVVRKATFSLHLSQCKSNFRTLIMTWCAHYLLALIRY